MESFAPVRYEDDDDEEEPAKLFVERTDFEESLEIN